MYTPARMIRTGLAALLLGSTLFSVGCHKGGEASTASSPVPGGSVVATVNGETIDQKELDQELNRLHGPEVLQALIDDRLISQAAKKDKIVVDEKDVQAQLDDLKKTPQYAALLKAKGMTDADLEKYMRRLQELKKLILLDIPEQDKLKMYDQYKEQLEQAHLYDIVVDKKEDADKIVSQLKAGGDFEAMARENSKDESSKNRGGDLNWVPRAAPIDPALAKVAFTIPINEVSAPIQVKNGWAIIKVTGRKKSYDELKGFIEERLVDMQQLNYVQRLRLKADIKSKYDVNKTPMSAASGAPASAAPASGAPAK